MSGCFGNSAEDRARERELDAYLEATDTSEDDEDAEEEMDEYDRAEYLREMEADRKMDEEREEEAIKKDRMK